MSEHNLPQQWAPQFAELDAYVASLNINREDPRRQGHLIAVLHRAQDIFGYLPVQVQQHVAKLLYLQESDVSGVVSFYNFFTTKAKGKYIINCCLGTACFVKGAGNVLAEFEKQLGIKANGEISADGLFSLVALRCVGACGLAPVVMIGDKVYARMKPEMVKDVIAEYKERA